MKKARKWISVLLAVCLSVLTFAGCGSGSGGGSAAPAAPSGETGGAAGNKPVVRVVVPGINEQETVDPISGLTSKGLSEFEKFLNEKIPSVQIKLLSIPWDGWIQKIEAMSTAGEMDVGFFTNQVAVPDWYMDLTPYLKKDKDVNFDNWKDLFVDPAIHYTTYKSFNYPEATGKVFGLPVTMACNLIVYDKQLFADWGVPEPTSQDTLDDLFTKASKMVGKNPKTGAQNYGAYFQSNYWTEWFAVSYDAVPALESDTMKLSDLDMDKNVNYIKDSPEVLALFKGLKKAFDASPEGIATKSGSEKFYTADNDIAINFDTANTGTLIKYLYADAKDVIDRFKPLLIPTGKNGQQGFPEFFHFSINKTAKDPDTAWEVVKALTTNKEIVDFYLMNYASDKTSALKDTEGMKIADYEINKQRHDYQMKTVFITDDYWFWRTPLQDVTAQLVSKQVTPEQARQKFCESVTAWVNNTKAQLGQ